MIWSKGRPFTALELLENIERIRAKNADTSPIVFGEPFDFTKPLPFMLFQEPNYRRTP